MKTFTRRFAVGLGMTALIYPRMAARAQDILFPPMPIARPDAPPAKAAPDEEGSEEPAIPLEDQLETAGFTKGAPVFVRIFKTERQLELWMRKDGKLAPFKTYEICAYSGDLGPKLKEGDHQSPEGFYMVSRKQLNPNSKYHLSFNLGFPNAYDKAQKRTGTYLMVHGDCVSVGCYAMTDDMIEEIYRLVEAALATGQEAVPVHIFPFRMTDEKMAEYKEWPWFKFWENLREGHDIFEETGEPPIVYAGRRKYVFGRRCFGCRKIAGW